MDGPWYALPSVSVGAAAISIAALASRRLRGCVPGVPASVCGGAVAAALAAGAAGLGVPGSRAACRTSGVALSWRSIRSAQNMAELQQARRHKKAGQATSLLAAFF